MHRSHESYTTYRTHWTRGRANDPTLVGLASFVQLGEGAPMPGPPSPVDAAARRFSRRLTTAVVIAVGIQLGVGAFTFGYGEGLSYFSSDPQACANCHIMRPYLDSWQKSSHHHVATCVDCHLPHQPLHKFWAKADNGYFHSMAFTLGEFPEPIRIKARNRRITQHNCITCHRELIDPILAPHLFGEAPACIHCHADVGHGPRSGGAHGPGR